MSNKIEQQAKDSLMAELKAHTALLATIARQLERLAHAGAPLSPNFRRSLSEYPGFDWTSIGAEAIARDDHGATEVEWHGHRFLRRSGGGKFGEAVWFSRPLGSSETGTEYARLITFKDYEAEPLDGSLQPSLEPPKQQRPARAQQPQQIKPLDVQQTARPAVAKPVNGDERLTFYDVGGKAMTAGQISIETFNGLVSKAGREGFGVALQDLRSSLA